MKNRAIAMDGPAGSGKSTLAKRLAKELGYLYVDTGAIYRTVALFALQEGVELEDEAAVSPLLGQINIGMESMNGVQRMTLNGSDVTEDIRRNEVSAAASEVSALPCVRAFLLERQRQLARENSVVMDGRDIGTVVLPDADVKVFLTASPEARARRRYQELAERGESVEFSQILREVIERDQRDITRAIAPLRQAEDAVLLDTTDLNLEQSFQRLLAITRAKV